MIKHSEMLFGRHISNLHITDTIKKSIVNNNQNKMVDVRIRMGKFYTDREIEERFKTLEKKLP